MSHPTRIVRGNFSDLKHKINNKWPYGSLFLHLCDSIATFKTFLVSNGNRTLTMYTHIHT